MGNSVYESSISVYEKYNTESVFTEDPVTGDSWEQGFRRGALLPSPLLDLTSLSIDLFDNII